jgi:hypothetical protein
MHASMASLTYIERDVSLLLFGVPGGTSPLWGNVADPRH